MKQERLIWAMALAANVAVISLGAYNITVKADTSVHEIRQESPAVVDGAGPIVIETEEFRAEAENALCEDESGMYYLGTFVTTGYCNCRRCCGKWSGGPTASGKMPRANHTVAVDPDVIPLGTRLLVNGVEYVAEDTGSGVDGKHLDIYYDDHTTAWNHGKQTAEVYVIE